MNPLGLIAIGIGLLLFNETAKANDMVIDTEPEPQPESNGNLSAFLMTIRFAEGTADDDGYRKLFGGSLFDSFADHPRKVVSASGMKSSAAGAYQIIRATWDSVIQPALNLPDFSPDSQDAAAIYLIQRRGAYDDVIAGRFADAIHKCRKEWASLPGAGYNQPERALDKLTQVYQNYGGTFA